jgi:integrase
MPYVTFSEQSKSFLEQSVNRKRNPVKPATAQVWKYSLGKWLVPFFKDAPLATVTNASMRNLVENFYKAGLSPQTITTYVNLVKLIVASAIDENGEEVYPRKWNSSFIDMPTITNQRRPSFTPEAMSSIVAKANGQYRVLYALLAGSGLRIGEALGLEVKHVSSDGRILNIEQSAWGPGIQTPKTLNAFRQVDLTPELALMLKTHIGGIKGNLVFANLAGNPLSQTNVLRRNLHPLLKQVGVPKQGFHGTRRFRTTWLRKQFTPPDLIHFWLGHAATSTTDIYSKLFEDVAFRQEVSMKVGLGFSVSC